MTKTLRNVLVVGLDTAAYDRVEPLLRRASFDVDRVQHARSAVALLEVVSFDIVILGYPQIDLSASDVMKVIRADGGPCQRSAVLILARPQNLRDAEGLTGNGHTHVMPMDASMEDLQREVSAVLRVAPRLSVRIPIRLEVELADGTTVVISQTENVSSGGMLVRTPRLYPIDSKVRFELLIPDETSAVGGIGMVVRHIQDEESGVRGIGVKFLAFDGRGGGRLRAFLDRILQHDDPS